MRRWTRHVLRGCVRVDDAALVVTELASNALLHTISGEPSGTFHVRLALSDHLLSISVTDRGGSKTSPTVEHPADGDLHGRGLAMVTALARHVETRGDDQGLTVTAHLTAHAEAS